MSNPTTYIHGASSEEQERLSLMNDRLLNEACLKELQLAGGERILDVGSGLGQFTRLMAQTVGPKGSVLGVEREIAQLKKARYLAAAAGENPNFSFRQGDAMSLPLDPPEWGSFDLVHTRFLLEHVPAPGKVVAQMARAVRPGGRVVLADDDHALFTPYPSPAGFQDIWQAYCRSYDRIGCDAFIGRRLTTLLHQAGLQPRRNTLVFFGGCAGDPTFGIAALNIIKILEGAKDLMLDHHLISRGNFDAGIDGLRKWMTLPDAALWYGMSWAEAVAPDA